MRLKAKIILLVLLTVMLAVPALADQKVTITAQVNGTITVDKQTAASGEMVTLTVSPAEGYRLKNGGLMVEQLIDTSDGDIPVLNRSAAPTVGSLLPVNRVSQDTYTFTMPAYDVEVSGAFTKIEDEDNTVVIPAINSETDQDVAGVTMAVTIGDDGSAQVDEIIIPQTLFGTSLTVEIPSTVKDATGKELVVTKIAENALAGQTNVTDIYLPETETPLEIAIGALTIDKLEGDEHHVAKVHTPLALLDDYALMEALNENYEAGKVMAMAKAVHKYWTFSCGVDVRIPDDVTFYTCSLLDDENIEIVEQNGKVVKANNGVLIACANDEGNAYEMVASPSEERPSGTSPATYDAKSYKGNLLQPVLESAHYGEGGYFIMSNNEFHPIIQEGTEARIPACKAVLFMGTNAQARVMSITKEGK